VHVSSAPHRNSAAAPVFGVSEDWRCRAGLGAAGIDARKLASGQAVARRPVEGHTRVSSRSLGAPARLATGWCMCMRSLGEISSASRIGRCHAQNLGQLGDFSSGSPKSRRTKRSSWALAQPKFGASWALSPPKFGEISPKTRPKSRRQIGLGGVPNAFVDRDQLLFTLCAPRSRL